MDHREVHYLEVLIAGAAGLVTGLCVGLMVAPRSGQDLRKQIADQGRRLEEQIRLTSENVVERVREAADEAFRRHYPGDINDLDRLDDSIGGEMVRDLERMPRR